MTKNKILISAITIAIIGSIVLILIDKNIKSFLILSGFVIFLLFALLDPPPKHKEHTWSDVRKAKSSALGGAGLSDASNKNTNRKKHKKKGSSEESVGKTKSIARNKLN